MKQEETDIFSLIGLRMQRQSLSSDDSLKSGEGLGPAQDTGLAQEDGLPSNQETISAGKPRRSSDISSLRTKDMQERSTKPRRATWAPHQAPPGHFQRNWRQELANQPPADFAAKRRGSNEEATRIDSSTPPNEPPKDDSLADAPTAEAAQPVSAIGDAIGSTFKAFTEFARSSRTTLMSWAHGYGFATNAPTADDPFPAAASSAATVSKKAESTLAENWREKAQDADDDTYSSSYTSDGATPYASDASVAAVETSFIYIDDDGREQGPFPQSQMISWYESGFLRVRIPITPELE